MSSLLEQAIVDAKALKEAAMKNAEATIIDKYSEEVKSTLNQLLEQDELEAALGGLGGEPTADAEATMDEEVEKDEIAEGVPDAFTEDIAELDGVNEGDEAEVTIDFKELAETLKQLREGVEEETLNEEGYDCIKDMMAEGMSRREAIAECKRMGMLEEAEEEEPMDEEVELDEESIMEMVAAMLSEEEEEVEEGVMKPRPGQPGYKQSVPAAKAAADKKKEDEEMLRYYNDLDTRGRGRPVGEGVEEEEVEERVLKGTPKNPVSRNPKSTAATTAAAKKKREDELERAHYGKGGDPRRKGLEEDEDLYEELSDEMLDAIMEKLTVDMGATLSGWAGRSEESVKHQMELEMAHRRSTEVAEELEALKKAQEELVFENKKLKENLSNYQEVVESLKENVQDVNLSNARLLYTNRTLRNTSLNERQKERIVEAISKAGSVEEAKTIHETLQSTVASTPARGPQSLSEAITRPTSVIRASRKEEPKVDPFTARMRKLAGIN